MSQHPRSVPSGSGLAVREGFNNALDSAFTLNSGSVAPASPQAGLLWLDTATGVLKIRNDANTNWVSLLDRLGGAGSGQVVRHDIAQTLTSGQKQQARENIAAVSYEAQSLTPTQQDQARANINAQVSGSYVRYDQTQSLTDSEKEQARSNVNAPCNPDGTAGYVGSAPAGGVSLPAGGRWWYLYQITNITTGGIYGQGSGVASGGTLIATAPSTQFQVTAHYWRTS